MTLQASVYQRSSRGCVTSNCPSMDFYARATTVSSLAEVSDGGTTYGVYKLSHSQWRPLPFFTITSQVRSRTSEQSLSWVPSEGSIGPSVGTEQAPSSRVAALTCND